MYTNPKYDEFHFFNIKHLNFSTSEATQIISQYGDYSEINLNAGCPSPRVSKRCFGAKLMLNPEHLREICSKMVRCSSVPITLKCRLGVDDHDSYDELTKLIEVVHSTGVRKFIIHARKCLLDGLTTKQNRDIPPLRCTMNIYYFNHFLFTDVSPINFYPKGTKSYTDYVKTFPT